MWLRREGIGTARDGKVQFRVWILMMVLQQCSSTRRSRLGEGEERKIVFLLNSMTMMMVVVVMPLLTEKGKAGRQAALPCLTRPNQTNWGQQCRNGNNRVNWSKSMPCQYDEDCNWQSPHWREREKIRKNMGFLWWKDGGIVLNWPIQCALAL